MNIDLILTAIVPIVVSIAGFFIKEIKADINMLKAEVQAKTTESEVRQIVSDKLDPLREDLQEIKLQIAKLTDYLLKR